MENKFLAVNKRYLKYGLKSVDILIIAQVEEFTRSTGKCFISNRQFSDMFGESESTIKRSLDKLEEMGILKRETYFAEGNGKSNKKRTLSVNDYSKWKVHNELTKTEWKVQNDGLEGSNSDDGRFKNEEWKVHNEPIIDNRKDNIKDNRIDKAVAISESLLKKIKSIGIEVKQNTINAIVEATGDSDINEEAISNIIDMCSQEGMFHGNSGYNFTVLRNQIADRYAEVNEFIRTQKEEEAEKKRKQEEINQQIRAAQPEIEQNREQLTVLCSILFPERQVDDMLLAGALRYSEKIEDVGAFVDYHEKNPNLSIKCKGFQQRYNTESICRDGYVNPIDCYIKYVQEDMRYHEQIIGA